MIFNVKYSWRLKDSIIRKLFKKTELVKNIIKSLLCSNYYSIKYKLYFNKRLYIYTKNSSISKYKIYCIFTVIGSSIFKRFKLSRMWCKYFASHGYLPGMRKSSF